MSLLIPRRTYADLYGPTKGDRIRLADTDLIIEIERDFTHYGDEITFGGGKVVRDGMGQSSTALRETQSGALDLVITNAVILDHWGIVKGDIGIKDGRIVKVGKAGNPDTDGWRSIHGTGGGRLRRKVIAGEHPNCHRGREWTAIFISFRHSKWLCGDFEWNYDEWSGGGTSLRHSVRPQPPCHAQERGTWHGCWRRRKRGR